MLAVLKNRNFALLWTGGLISMIGNWMLMAALPFHVYSLTESALATSGILLAYVAPGILLGSLAGVFVDRWDRKRTMLVVSLMQAAVIACMLFARSMEWLWVIYVVALVESGLRHFFSPAENALLPNLVGEEHLMAANSMNAMNDNLARLVGPAVGGALLGLVGFHSVILADAASYLLAALLIVFVHAPQREAAAVPVDTAPEADSGPSLKTLWVQMWQEWLAGLRYVRSRKLLMAMFVVTGVALFGDSILSAILVVFVQVDMGLNATQFGWLMTARGIGGLLGGVLLAQIGQKFTPGQLAAGGLFAAGGLILVMVAFPILPAALPLLVLAGIAVIGWIVSGQTLMQLETEDAYRGRVFGSFGTSVTLLMFVGTAIAGALGDLIGSLPLMNAAAVIYLIAGGLAWKLLAAPAGNTAAIPETAAAD